MAYAHFSSNTLINILYIQLLHFENKELKKNLIINFFLWIVIMLGEMLKLNIKF